MSLHVHLPLSWINVLHQMMGEFVKLIVEPALHGQPDDTEDRDLGRWVPCETLAQ